MAAFVSQMYKGGKQMHVSSVLINCDIPQWLQIICQA